MEDALVNIIINLVQYTDISQFNTFTVINVEPPQSNRMTMGFWVYVSSISTMNSSSNNVIHISVSGYFVITLNAPSSSSIDVYCSVGFKVYNSIDTFTSLSSFQSYLSSNNIQYTKATASNVGQRWFYTRCAMSFDHGLTYTMTKTDGNAPTVQSTSLNLETLYPATLNDVYFRTNYRSGDTLTLSIKFGSNVGTPVFLKNLYIFREFIPYDNYFHY